MNTYRANVKLNCTILGSTPGTILSKTENESEVGLVRAENKAEAFSKVLTWYANTNTRINEVTSLTISELDEGLRITGYLVSFVI